MLALILSAFATEVKKLLIRFMIFLLATLAGCSQSPIKPVETAPLNRAKNTALIAFSVKSNEPFALRKIELMAAGPADGSKPTRIVDVNSDASGASLFLFETPVTGLQFGALQFKSGMRWWQTRSLGPTVTGNSKSITYIGRIQLHSVRVGQYAQSEKTYPSDVKIEVADASAEDLPNLYRQYKIPADLPVQVDVPEKWNDRLFINLKLIDEPNDHDHNHGMEPIWAGQGDNMPGG